MATYSYPDGGETDPRIETPDLPQPEPPSAVNQSAPTENPLQNLVIRTLDELLRCRMVWAIERGSVEFPAVGDLLDNSIEELMALARLYRVPARPAAVTLGTENAAEALITLTESMNRLASQPMPLAMAAWFGNLTLQLMVILGR